MKITIIIIILLSSFYTKILGQNSFEEYELLLNNYYENKEYSDLFKKIKLLCDIAYNEENTELLIRIYPYLKRNFGSLSEIEKGGLRLAAASVGNRLGRMVGNYDEALSILLIAHENVKDKITLDSLVWFVENGIFNIYTRKGDYEKAEYYATISEVSLIYHQSFYKHPKWTELLSRLYSNRGIKYKSEQKIIEAIDIFKQGLKIADSIGYQNGIFSNLLNLATLFNEYPHLDSPQKYLDSASQILSKLESDRPYLEKKAGWEIEKAKYLSYLGLHSESIIYYKEAIQSLKSYYSNTNRREFAKYYSMLASKYLEVDSIQNAKDAVDSALKSLIPDIKSTSEIPLLIQLYADNSFIEIFRIQIEINKKEFLIDSNIQRLEKAVSIIDQALYVNDLIRESVTADPSKLVNIEGNKQIIETGISLLYQLYIKENNSKYLNNARKYFNRSKSLLFGEKTRKNNILEIMTDTDKEKWSDLQTKIIQLHNQKYDREADLNMINGEILNCLEQVDQIFLNYNNFQFSEQKPENYIEYFTTNNEIYIISEINLNRKFIKLSHYSEFEKLLARLEEYIRLKTYSLDNTILNEMYKYLVEPVIEACDDALIIIPDGTLGYVPFEMLKDNEGRYLLEKFDISYSFEYITQVLVAAKTENKLDIFCLAPDYPLKSTDTLSSSRGSLYHLPYAKMEVNAIKELFNEGVLESESADKQNWIPELNKVKVFHYAGHAIIKSGKAYLALTASEEESQQLTAKEIGLMSFPLDMVVLSACETGLGVLEKGEGIRSLGKSFMEGGAKSTIISLWVVNDKSTSTIMTSFYKYLHQGKRKDQALRLAKLDYIKSSTSNYSHPYFWAAFIPTGDMMALEFNN